MITCTAGAFSIFVFAALLLAQPAVAQNKIKHVTPKQAQTLLDKDTSIVVLDVRTPEELQSATGKLPRAINIPVQDLEKRLTELDKYKSREILVYCRSGNRSTRASNILLTKDFKLIHLDGGILQWNTEIPASSSKEEKKN
jgi:adenylyltransferase/sulfurtransferase